MNNFPPQTEATTFALSSVFFLLLCPGDWKRWSRERNRQLILHTGQFLQPHTYRNSTIKTFFLRKYIFLPAYFSCWLLVALVGTSHRWRHRRVLNKALSHLIKVLSSLSKALSHLIKMLSPLSKALSHLIKALSHLSKALSHVIKALSHLSKALSHLIKALSHLSKALSHFE